jgi:transcriptional regulator with XRE-family HTH domain
MKVLRELNNYSQEYVAGILEINQNSYSKLETGHTKLTIDRVKKLAELYKVPIEYFFKEDFPFVSYNTGKNSHSNMVIQPKKYVDVNNEEAPDPKLYDVFERLLAEKERLIQQYQIQIEEGRKEREQLIKLIEKLSN